MEINYQNFLTSYFKENQTELFSNNKKLWGLSLTRIFLFLSIILCVYSYFKLNSEIWLIIAGLLFIAFIVFIKLYNDLKIRINYFKSLLQIIEDEKKYIQDDFSSFESGEEFIDNRHPFSTDLDVFGEKSLFQRISRSSENAYKVNLAQHFKAPSLEIKQIISRQDILKDLKSRRQFRLESRVLLNSNDTVDKSSFRFWLNSQELFTGIKWDILRFTLLILSSGGITLSFVQGGIHSLLIVTMILNLAVLGLLAKKINHYHNIISMPGDGIKAYLQLSQNIQSQSFSSDYLNELKSSSKLSEVKLKSLQSGIKLLDQRLNGFVGLLLNLFFAYDLWIIRRLEKWKKAHSKSIIEFLEEIVQYKVYESMANYVDHHPHFTFPNLTEDIVFHAFQLAHPFLSEEEAIGNEMNFSAKDNFYLITGANMAGKSTFLRAIGINWIMGMSGLPVNAQVLNMKPVRLMTSMRINDSLVKGDSYFKAEVERLKSIIDFVSGDETRIILLDEVLRGTNSTDKRTGTIGFCEKLQKLGAKGLLATHDLEVARHFEASSGIKNINFESRVEGDQLVFDYKLREGIAQNTNASIIMRQRGIID